MSAGPVVGLFAVALIPAIVTTTRLVWMTRHKLKVGPSDSAANSLTAAKAAGARVSFAVQFGFLSAGWFFFVIGASAWVLPYDVWPVQFFSLMPMWPLGGALMLLSVRPTDEIATMVATPLVQLGTFWFGGNLVGFFLAIVSAAPQLAPPFFPILIIGIVNFICGLLLIRNYIACHSAPKLLYSGPPRSRLNRIWRSYRIFTGFMSIFFLVVSIANSGAPPPPPEGAAPPAAGGASGSGAAASEVYNDPTGTRPASTRGGDFTNVNDVDLSTQGPVAEDVPGSLAAFIICVLICFGLRPAVRRKFHAFLGSLASKGEAKAAAAVAGLVGGRSPSEALKHGVSTFRALPMDQLALSDLSTSADTGLHAKTIKVMLGEVDAFLSHSWHDDASQKWGALEKWSSEKGVKPNIWLDKACINQQMIDESLAALPVYLSGCKSLLVVAGATYTTRLWCVMELFVFLQMGGELHRVSALALPGRDVNAALATFTAEKATCFKQEDRQRLLGIIESAFGDFSSFNARVRSIFRKRSTTKRLSEAEVAVPTQEMLKSAEPDSLDA